MSDNQSVGYYQPSKGSLTGFDKLNIPTDNPNIYDVGWSVENLRRYLENQSGANFPSSEFIQSVEQAIRDHENDFDNPHKTTLSQIVGDIISQVIGAVVPGTPPTVSPFYVFDASCNLPLGTIFPASYTTANLYRRSQTGSLIDAEVEQEKIGTDTTAGLNGLPLYSTMENITPGNWASLTPTLVNTTFSDNTDLQTFYPFVFKDVKETPIAAMFGVDIPMTQNLQTAYTCSFYIKKGDVDGSVRIYQPSDSLNYIEVNLTDASASYFTDTMTGSFVKYQDDVIRASITFTSSASLADNALRVIHLDTDQTGNGTRQGSLGRRLFSIGKPQTTTGAIDQPTFVDPNQVASCPRLDLNMSSLGIPDELTAFIVAFSVSIKPTPQITPVVDPTILSLGGLTISRDQTKVRVTVDGTQLFTSDILEGINTFAISYSPTKIIFKDITGDRQVVTGVYPSIVTADASFGPCGGYLLQAAFYNQVDDTTVVEYLTNA